MTIVSNTRAKYWLASIIIVVALIALCPDSAPAQCAMCKEALTNSEAAATAKQFNFAILVLLVPPVAMFFGIFGLIYRSGRTKPEELP